MCTTVEEFLHCYQQQWVDLPCGKEICILNIAQSMLRPYIYDLPDFEYSQTVDVTTSNLLTANNMFKIKSFYWKACCEWNTCLVYNETCCDCIHWYWRIPMRMKNWADLNVQEYAYRPWTKQITYRLPEWICEAYLIYHRWPTKLTDKGDCIDIPEHLHWLLAMMVMYNMRADDRDRLMIDIKEQVAMFKEIYAYKWEVTSRAKEGHWFTKLK